jgi:hypothetical protein
LWVQRVKRAERAAHAVALFLFRLVTTGQASTFDRDLRYFELSRAQNAKNVAVPSKTLKTQSEFRQY